MKLPKSPLFNSLLFGCAAIGAATLLVNSAPAQVVAYDDAGNYQIEANWTNGANRGFGFTPWVIVTNTTGAPEFHGTYITAAAVTPPFANASITNVLGTNYTNVWGLFANGTNGYNETTGYRGFENPLGTNTFKIQWGAKGAGATLTPIGTLHGYCGFTLRNGNATNSSSEFASGARFVLYFLDGASPSTLYITDGFGDHSVPGTSFSDLGRGNITNAVQAEVTVGSDGDSYHLILKDCVAGRTLYTLDSTLAGAGTIDSAALFCQETTGDQVYNRMQISVPQIPPVIANLQPASGSMYLDANATSLSFELTSFVSTVVSNLVSVSLNGVPQANLTFSTADPTNHLYVNCPTVIAPNTFYSWTIAAQDANGDAVTNTYTFNTFLPSNLFIDAYDYNYGAGQFVNAFTPSNSYANFLGTNGIDYLETDLSGTNNLYRPGDLPQVISLATDATGDPIDHADLRLNGFTAYNIGFTIAGEWQNYTRSVSTATNYSIYARAASGTSGQFEIAKLANPTATTSNQPLVTLGQVNVPFTGGSRVYSAQLMPLTDVFGNTVVVPLSGTNTIRCTTLSNQGYNLEYLVVVPVTNATGTLRPYIATGSPVPNAMAVNVSSKIIFSIANRQTTVNTNTIKLFLNSVSMPIVISSNAAGSLVTFTPSVSLPSNATNVVGISFTDNTGANLTNFWTFVTSGVGGVPGNGLWSGAGLFDQYWSTAGNWSGGVPGPGFNAVFASLGATNNLATNNIVATNVTIRGLFYNTNNVGYHSTWIQDGVTLTVTNGATGVAPAVQVGGGVNSDNVFAPQVTNTITGIGGTLLVLGNPQGSGLNNSLNFQVRQQPSASTSADYQTSMDMSGLGTLVAVVGKVTVGQGGGGGGQNFVSGRLLLARTNTLTLLRPVAGQFVIGDSSGGSGQSASSILELGITNTLFFDSMNLGNRKATNSMLRFNPSFISANPVAYIRGTNGNASRVLDWHIGDAANETTVPVLVSGTADFSGGKLDALVNTLIVGRGATTAGDSGFAQGTLTTPAGTLDVNNLQVGVQRAVNTATEAGIVNINDSATLICTAILLAQTNVGATASLVTGTLNVTTGTVRGNIVAGGGNSIVNVNAGTLVVSNAVGTPAVPLSTLNLTGASLHLNVDGNATAAIVNATSVSASGTTITIDSVANVAGPHTIHLIAYTGSNPFNGLSLAPLPAGYTGNLVDNSGVVDLNITVSAPPPPPKIADISFIGGQLVISGTNNNGAGGTYSVLTSTNVALPLANWTVLSSGSFNGSGNFAFTNSPVTNSQRFYILRVP